MIRKCAVLAVGIAWVVMINQGAQPTKSYIELDSDGSMPPLPQLYECTRELDSRPYDAGQTQSCLQTILASGYFESGRIETEPRGRNLLVHFRFTVAPLTVQRVDFEVEDRFRDQMLRWLRSRGVLVKRGEVYQSDLDLRLTNALSSFFQELGKRAGFTRIVRLDYGTKSATLTYRIAVVPDSVPMRGLPPFNTECKVPIHMFAVTDIDDLVPVNLAERMTKTHAFGCFDATTIAEDQDTLKKSNLFNEVYYDVKRSPGGRDVSLHIRGKPLRVKEVRVVGCGLLSGRLFVEEPQLALRAGATYRRSDSFAACEFLSNKYTVPNQNTEVYEEDQLNNDDELIVILQILNYEQDQVIINGKEFWVPPLVLTGHS